MNVSQLFKVEGVENIAHFEESGNKFPIMLPLWPMSYRFISQSMQQEFLFIGQNDIRKLNRRVMEAASMAQTASTSTKIVSELLVDVETVKKEPSGKSIDSSTFEISPRISDMLETKKAQQTADWMTLDEMDPDVRALFEFGMVTNSRRIFRPKKKVAVLNQAGIWTSKLHSSTSKFAAGSWASMDPDEPIDYSAIIG
ncbi:hypothetical protein BDR26DRAFT_3881 [Obelidium mucronatum]|nr:hypothetical protein BDR26DRAFT_3881 [Obelidium mucronatum]